MLKLFGKIGLGFRIFLEIVSIQSFIWANLNTYQTINKLLAYKEYGYYPDDEI